MRETAGNGVNGTRTASLQSEGADLVYDLRGSGDPLILIPGAGGDAGIYGRLAPLLSDAFTVITYDRRCNARSSGDRNAAIDMAQQARDVVAVLRRSYSAIAGAPTSRCRSQPIIRAPSRRWWRTSRPR